MHLHELTENMRQKDMKFVKCLKKICTTVPLEGSEEDKMLQACELKLNPNNEKLSTRCNACICMKCPL